MEIKHSFIVVDDSELDRFIIRKVIEHFDKSLHVETYQSAEHALDAIRENKDGELKLPAIILLDIHIPLMNGFEFIEEFEKLEGEIRDNYTIVVLSILLSVTNPVGIHNKLKNGTIHSVLDKPLTLEKLSSLLTRIKSTESIK